jgi:hypothetical protein
MTQIHKKMAMIGNWVGGSFSQMNIPAIMEQVDIAKATGFDSVSIYLGKIKISYIRSGATDLTTLINNIRAKGLGVYFLLGTANYCPIIPVSGDFNSSRFWQDAPIRTAFMDDFNLLMNYNFDGFSFEEPVSYGLPISADPNWRINTQPKRDWYNLFFKECRDIVISKKGTTWTYGFNSPSTGIDENANLGLDLAYINGVNPTGKPLFNQCYIQSGVSTVQQFIDRIATWKASDHCSNMEVIPLVYSWYSGLFNVEPCKSTPYSVWQCYNQATFDQLKYCVNNNITFSAFTIDRWSINPYYFPTETWNSTVGTTMLEKTKIILNTTGTCPTPQYNYIIT